MNYRTPTATLAALTLLLLAGCSTAPAPGNDAGVSGPAAAGDGHGSITGAAEVAEPQLHLVSMDADGKASMLDLLTGTESELPATEPPSTVSSEGRYVFAANDTGVDILDSGVWSWDHVDHFHYYRAEPGAVGRLTGAGTATISTGMLSTAGGTGVFFPGSGDAVLLDNSALSEGSISEKLRLHTEPHKGLIAPLGDGAVVTAPDQAGRTVSLRAVDADGKEAATIGCTDAAGTITTRVGLVIGCSDGAVIATLDGTSPVLEHVPYPDAAAAAATAFNGRKGRPTVAGVGDGAGVWLLDTRERSWNWLPTETPVLAAAAVDDAEEHVVVVGADGTVKVYDASTGKRIAATEPLLAATLADPSMVEKVQLTVDGQRAYVNAPAEGVVFEIDYADAARIARTLELPTTPVHVAEVGR
ncbi:ABC transporter [Paenarthrobacter sp. NPDC089989]|uniref:ABC transporter n=1 Tax=unclassified Paenarthrobacter TaxID=2634190 RepID=UPI003817CD34